MKLQMLKRALIAYVTNSVKAIWSVVAHPLTIVGKKNCDVADYRIYGNSVQNGEPTPEAPIEVQSVGELTTKNLFDKDNLVVNRYWNIKSWTSTDTGVVLSGFSGVNGHCCVDIGLAKDYVGKTLCLSWETDKSINTGSTRMIIADSANTVILQGSTPITLEDGTKYSTFSITGEYTTEILRLRLYFSNIDVENTVSIEYRNIMLCESSEYVPYEPYHKYKVPITVRGKNILRNPLELDNWRKNALEGFNKYSYMLNDMLPINQKVTLSCEIKDDNNIPEYFYFFTDDDSVSVAANSTTADGMRAYHLTRDKLIRLSLSFTPREGKMYFLYSALNANNNSETVTQNWLNKFSYIQIEVGDTATEYEPYVEPKNYELLLDAPLRRVGEYADYIDFEKGVVVRNVEKRIFDGTEKWEENHWSKNLLNQKKVPNVLSDTTRKYITVSSHLTGKTWENLSRNNAKVDGSLEVGIATAFNSTYSVRYTYVCPYSTLITVDEWKAQLTTWHAEGNPFIVWYAISPIEEPIELPTLPQFKGTTVYEAQTEIPPSGMQVQYY